MRWAVLPLLVACSGEVDDDDDDGGGLFGDTTGGGLVVEMVTGQGTIVIALEPTLTPETTDNFLAYAESGFYDGSDGSGATVFHRVVDGFVIQGGGYTSGGSAKGTSAPISLETNLGLSNVRGTIAMARTADPDSATSQFFFNLVDNTFLDYQSESEPGYAVFGAVTSGMDVIDTIASAPVNGESPQSPVQITAVTVR